MRAPAKPHRRTRREMAAMCQRPKAITRGRLELLYRRHLRQKAGPCQDSMMRRHVFERGLETRWQVYLAMVRRDRFVGGGFYTTNEQRLAGLEDRIRSRRAIQRALHDLRDMGVIVHRHVVRSGPARRPGQMDCLAIQLSPISGICDDTPREAERGGALKGPNHPSQTAQRPLVAPPSAADNDPPAAGEPPSAAVSEGGVSSQIEPEPEAERAARFQAMKAAAGWTRRQGPPAWAVTAADPTAAVAQRRSRPRGSGDPHT